MTAHGSSRRQRRRYWRRMGCRWRCRLVADADELTAAVAKMLEAKQPVASRLVRVHGYYWLRMWLETGAMSGVGTLPAGTDDVEDGLFMVGSRVTA